MTAINDGKINRYFTKPWDAAELREAIGEELESYHTQHGQQLELERLAGKNLAMKEKVSFTSELLNGTTDLLAASNYRTCVRLNETLMSYRLPAEAELSKRCTETATGIARQMSLTIKEREQVSLAASLHLIGLMALPDSILTKEPEEMNAAELREYYRYPEIGAHLLSEAGESKEIASLVRHHCEDVNGHGFPAQLPGEQLPIGARIIHVASDFERQAERLGPGLALIELMRERGTKYDPDVLDALTAIRLNITMQPNTDQQESRPCH